MTEPAAGLAGGLPTVRHVPAVVVGTGVAGLATAIGLGRCALLTDGSLGSGGSTPLAQGGVAAAVADDDSPQSHAQDTLAVSAGLGVATMANLVAEDGPDAIQLLLELGANFDRAESGALALGREAGHAVRRIVHANGDATGYEVARTLVAAVTARPEVEVWERTRAIDLVRADGRVQGVLAADEDGNLVVFLAEVVVLATGGYAHCFERTTTPEAVIGSGIAMAARAGAQVADMEFVQFHPTALAIAGDERLPLLTEALRGEGAWLVNDAGERHLLGVHADAELAPRDVVARANYRQLLEGRQVFLDTRHCLGDDIATRFPTVFELARRSGFDPRTEPLPVAPAAHYCMGGIAVDADGRSSIEGLWAVGEVASSGLHGANRLASNSLLEGLVMGCRAAASATAPDRSSSPAGRSRSRGRGRATVLVPADLPLSLDDGQPPSLPAGWVDGTTADVGTIRRVLWEGVGVERHQSGLSFASQRLQAVSTSGAATMRSRNMLAVANMVVEAATMRTESRGAHARLDHPDQRPDQATRRVLSGRASRSMVLPIESSSALQAVG